MNAFKSLANCCGGAGARPTAPRNRLAETANSGAMTELPGEDRKIEPGAGELRPAVQKDWAPLAGAHIVDIRLVRRNEVTVQSTRMMTSAP
jgi:hypothetical protein